MILSSGLRVLGMMISFALLRINKFWFERKTCIFLEGLAVTKSVSVAGARCRQGGCSRVMTLCVRYLHLPKYAYGR